MKSYPFLLALILLLFSGCSSMSQKVRKPSPAEAQNFKDYWYAGEAELASYDLEQARYGEMRKGDAVLIFVTEPFSEKKQVKLDNPAEARDDNVTVMKLNFTKKFMTGIYPYSMMYSIFTPVSVYEHPHSLKLTTSSQEWCGHTFLQMNLRNRKYQVNSYSYFESEGDQEFALEPVFLEDELWTKVRLNPEDLPEGDIRIIPGTFYSRLGHRNLVPQDAVADLLALDSSEYSTEPHKVYDLEYADRSLKVYFQSGFPYQILGWEEAYASGFRNPKEMVTKAKLKATLKTDYWTKNHNADSVLRSELKLNP